MLNEAIVLAGGLGTRLQGVVNDLPKPMAPIGTRPFLAYLLDYLKKYEIKKVVLAVGYKFESIQNYFGQEYQSIELVYAIEKEPLGTGGGIANALNFTEQNEVFLLNGDSFFNVDLNRLLHHHRQTKADLTLSLKAMQHFDRYGTVKMDKTRITEFAEKMPVEHGFINGGVYILNRKLIEQPHLPKKFSFEKEVMESGVRQFNLQGYLSDGYFIDIGIPEDYRRAMHELPMVVS